MKTADKIIFRESKYIAVWVLILSIFMQSFFLIVGKWNYTVLLGNLISGAAAILNFFLMGITVQAAAETDEKTARGKMKLSHTLRTFMLFLTAAIGCTAPCFNTVAVLLPLFFPRIAIAVRPVFQK